MSAAALSWSAARGENLWVVADLVWIVGLLVVTRSVVEPRAQFPNGRLVLPRRMFDGDSGSA